MKFIYNKTNLETKDACLNFISEVIEREFETSQITVRDGLLARENQVSTGLVDEIAIPHTMANVSEPVIVYLQNTNKISDWETMDGTEVKHIISIIAPEGQSEHLKILSQISRKLMNEDVVEKLKTSNSSAQLRDILDV